MTKATPHYLLCYNTSVIFHLLKGPLILDFCYIGLLYWTGCHNALNRPIKCLKKCLHCKQNIRKSVLKGRNYI